MLTNLYQKPVIRKIENSTNVCRATSQGLEHGRSSRQYQSRVSNTTEPAALLGRVSHMWRDLPAEVFGSWQTVWNRHRRYAKDGTRDRILAVVLAEADAAGRIDWNVSVDSTVARAHQHATNTTRPDQDTWGLVELQE